MKTLEELRAIQPELEALVMHQPGVVGVEIGVDSESMAAESSVCLRILVSDPTLTMADLKLSKHLLKEYPIRLVVRDIELF